MPEPVNPFSTTQYLGKKYFCDRLYETEFIRQHLHNGMNIYLSSVRRMGKTALIQHIQETYHNLKNNQFLYLDIFNTQNLSELILSLTNAIYKKFPPKNSIGKKFWELITLLRPTINFDPLTNLPNLSLDFGKSRNLPKSLESILQFLEHQSFKIVIAIDEFQQILQYPETNVEAILRGQIQFLKNIRFIFSGSNQNQMTEIFNGSKRPFYRSCINVSIRPIETQVYKKFIIQQFKAHQKNITPETVDFILDYTQAHTYYTQFLCYQIWNYRTNFIDLNTAKKAAYDTLKLNENYFQQIRHLITSNQFQLLVAISKEGQATNLFTHSFAQKYAIPASTIQRSLAALLAKELIVVNNTTTELFYELSDKFFMRWLQQF